VRCIGVFGVRAEFETQLGVQKYLFTFQIEGDKLTGKATSDVNGRKRETELKEGAIRGDTVSFVELLNFQGNELRIRYTGKLGANEIAFTREVGDSVVLTHRESMIRSPWLVKP